MMCVVHYPYVVQELFCSDQLFRGHPQNFHGLRLRPLRPRFYKMCLNLLQFLCRPRQVYLVADEQVGSVGQTRLVLVQLKLEVLQLMPGLLHGEVKDVDETQAALNVFEETDAQTLVLMGPGDQPRDVCN